MAGQPRPSGSDPVDWAEYFWAEHDLPADATPFLAMSSLLRYQRLVYLAMESELREYELNPTDYMLLMSLELSKDRTRLVGALARNIMVHATTATLAVDRLEARGLLERHAHPTDRRAMCVTLTSDGSRHVRAATKSLSDSGFGLREAKQSDVQDLLRVLTGLRAAAGDTGGI